MKQKPKYITLSCLVEVPAGIETDDLEVWSCDVQLYRPDDNGNIIGEPIICKTGVINHEKQTH